MKARDFIETKPDKNPANKTTQLSPFSPFLTTSLQK